LLWDNHKSGRKNNGSNRKTNQSAGIEKTVAILATAIPARVMVVAAVVGTVAVAELAVAAEAAVAFVAVVVAAAVTPVRAISEPRLRLVPSLASLNGQPLRRGDKGKAE
jgi:hypothetical protein